MVAPAILRSNLYRLAHVLHWGRHGNVHPHKLHRHVLGHMHYVRLLCDRDRNFVDPGRASVVVVVVLVLVVVVVVLWLAVISGRRGLIAWSLVAGRRVGVIRGAGLILLWRSIRSPITITLP